MKKIRTWLARYLDDLLLVAGCLFILRGLSLWNQVVTWAAAGLMLIGFGVMIAKEKTKHVAE